MELGDKLRNELAKAIVIAIVVGLTKFKYVKPLTCRVAATLKVREKGILILPKALREKAGIKEGSMVMATALDDGIILSPKETNVLGKLLGLAKISEKVPPDSTSRVRSMRSRIDEEQAQGR